MIFANFFYILLVMSALCVFYVKNLFIRYKIVN